MTGINGWTDFGSYHCGRSMADAACSSCKYFKYEQGDDRAFYCKRGLSSGGNVGTAADKLSRGIAGGGCKYYEGEAHSSTKTDGSSGRGVMSGLGQMIGGSGLGGGGISADNIVGGAGKVVSGLGGLAIRGIANGLKETPEEKTRAKEEEAIEKAKDLRKMQITQSVTFESDSMDTCNKLETLYSLKPGILDTLNKSDIVKAIIGKMELGIQILRSIGDNGNAEIYEKKLKRLKSQKTFFHKFVGLLIGGVLLSFSGIGMRIIGGAIIVLIALWSIGVLEILKFKIAEKINKNR